MDWLKQKLGWQVQGKSSLRVGLYPRASKSPFMQVLVQHLEEFGVEVTLLESLSPRRIWEAKGRLDWLWLVNVDPYHSPFEQEDASAQAYRFARRLSALRLARTLGIRVGWFLVNQLEHYSSQRFALTGQTALLNQSDRIWCLGQAMADRLYHEWPGVKSSLVRVSAPLGYGGYYPEEGLSRTQALERLGISTEGKVFLCYGSVHPYKGLTDLIPLFRKQPLREHCLVVAGAPSTPQYAHAIEGLSARTPGVHLFLRPIPDGEVERFFRAADFVVLPSKKIRNNELLMQVMTFGKALIGPRVPALTQWMDETNTIFFRQSDRNDLKDALEKALTVDLDEMSLHTRNLAQKHHPDTVLREWLRDMMAFIPGKALMEDYHDEV